jgi:hypothetical protein
MTRLAQAVVLGQMDRGREMWYAGSDYHASVGIARRDITPPIGIYARSWGAAEHDCATGVHRPLTVTALAIETTSTRRAVVTLDLLSWRDTADEGLVRGRIRELCRLAEVDLLVHLVHTHSGPSTCRADQDKPGGQLIGDYLESVAASAASAVAEAFRNARPSCITWGYGRCNVAQNRDLRYGDRFLVGWNPDAAADDTLLVGRVTSDDGSLVATVVNYACHPTTLGWDNTLLSPDFVGALREVVEQWSPGAPCLFLQGASGDLGPAEQYSADPAVADKTGRSIGYAALGVLEMMPAPDVRLRMEQVVESGAPLAAWRPSRVSPSSTTTAELLHVTVTRRPPNDRSVLERRWAHIPPGPRAERIGRALRLERSLGTQQTIEYPVWVWTLGDAVVIAHPGEAYSWFQRHLRAQLAPRPVVVMNLTNGAGSFYLPTHQAYDFDWYQVWQTRVERGALEQVAAAIVETLGTRQGSSA